MNQFFHNMKYFFSPENVSFQAEDAFKNRQQIADELSIDIQRMVFPHQVHSANVCCIGEESAGCGVMDDDTSVHESDGLLTDVKGLCLVIQTADCIPVLLSDEVAGVVGAIHAGWRGTVAGVVRRAIEIMIKRYHCKPENIHAITGPGIGPCCFETSEDIANQIGREFVRNYSNEGRPMVNLPLANVSQMLAMGLKHANIVVSGICTCCDPIWPSYRRDKKNRRLASAIML